MEVDSSKDLEKDEREAMEATYGWQYDLRNRDQIEAQWLAAKAHFKARLQQVEAERDEARDQSNIVEISDRKRAAEYDAERYRAELSIAREALEFYADPDTYFAIAMVADPPCGEFIGDFEELPHDGFRPGKRARDVLARLQAKEEGT